MTDNQIQEQAHLGAIEQSIIGGIGVDATIINNIEKFLEPKMFSNQKTGAIFDACLNVYRSGFNPDELSVIQYFRDNPKYGIGVSEVMDAFKWSSSLDVYKYSLVVKNEWMRREVRKVAEEAYGLSNRNEVDSLELAENLIKGVEAIVDNTGSDKGAQSFLDTVREMDVKLSEITEGVPSGVPSGLTELDELTGGWQKGRLYIIGARPAMGKSALVTTAQKNAADNGFPSVIFSLEMGKAEIGFRIISEEVGIPYTDMTKGRLSSHQIAYIREQLANIDLPIYIDDTPAAKLERVKSECRKLKRAGKLQLVVIDYLQLMSGDSSKSGGNREQEISEISRGLKALAKELDVPVIALSQLSRAVEQRENKRPQLSDLRESGSIEQDADMVMFLFRPEYYYNEAGEECPEELRGKAQLIVAKSRYTDLGDIRLDFIGAYSVFRDRSDLEVDLSVPLR